MRPTLAAAAPPLRPTPRAAAPKPAPSPSGIAATPDAILSAWTAIEALSPQTYRRPEDLAAGDKRCFAPLAKDKLPWEDGERSRKNYRLYYLVVLGAIPMAKAAELLTAAFGENEEQTPRLREKAAIAAVLIDRNGMIEDNRRGYNGNRSRRNGGRGLRSGGNGVHHRGTETQRGHREDKEMGRQGEEERMKPLEP